MIGSVCTSLCVLEVKKVIYELNAGVLLDVVGDVELGIKLWLCSMVSGFGGVAMNNIVVVVYMFAPLAFSRMSTYFSIMFPVRCH